MRSKGSCPVRTGAVAELVGRTFRRLGDAEAWLEGERTNARRGGWIDPTRGKETLGSFYDRWKQQAAETGRPSERTMIAYDEPVERLADPSRRVDAVHQARCSGQVGLM
jgi:hypothetical protein